MAIAFRSASSAADDSNTTTTIVVNKPASVAVDDVMLMIASTRADRTISTPSGWTRLDDVVTADTTNSGLRSATFYRVVDGSEGSTFSVVYSGNVRGSVAIAAYSGATVTGAQNAVQNNAAGDTITTPSVTTTNANQMVVGLGSFRSSTAMTPDAATTERADEIGAIATAYIADEVKATAGATTARVHTRASGTADQANQGFTVALQAPTVATFGGWGVPI